MKRKNAMPFVHPGEFIREYIPSEAGFSVTAAAKALGVSRQMVHDMLAAKSLCPLSCD